MTPRLASIAAAAGLAIILTPPTALAAASDYAFEPVAGAVRNGPNSELAVRLVHKPSGKPVAGAVVFRTRLDMSPDKMGAMTAKHEALTAAEPGVYKYRADLTMAGGWALRLMAKVPGETETVHGAVVFQAKD